MLPERAGVVRGNVIFARETFFDAEEAGWGTVAMRAAMFGSADIAMIFVDGCEVRAAALGASDEGFRSFAVGDGMSQAEAAAALDEGRAIFKSPDGGLAAKEEGGRTAHEFKAVAVWIIEGENDARVYFTSQVLPASEPSGLREDAAASTDLILH
jgi:hypothetical protein